MPKGHSLSTLRPIMRAAAICLLLLFAGAPAVAQASQTADQSVNIINYQVPAGPEMTPSAAADSVIPFARAAGQFGELTVSTTHSTFAQAQAVVESRSSRTANVGGVSEIAEWRQSPVYLVELKTTTSGGEFTPNVPVPQGRTGPSGEVMALILDAHTGAIEGRHIGSAALALSELGPVATTYVPAESATAFAASARARERAPGLVFGKLYVRGHLKSGWRIVIADSRVSLTKHPTTTLFTGSGGLFTTRLHPGKYAIGASARSARKLCGVRSLTVPRSGASTVTVRC
jgi:hypothetical protein